MLLNDLKSLRASAEKRKKDLLAAKKAREDEKARIEAERVRVALVKEQERLRREEDLANKKKQIEIDRKKKARDREIQKKLQERERLKVKTAEARELSRLLEAFLKRSVKGYTYDAGSTFRHRSSEKKLREMGFRFIDLYGKSTNRNPTTFAAEQKSIKDQLAQLQRDEIVSNQATLVKDLPKMQEQVLMWLEKLGLPAPHKISRKTAADRLEYFKRSVRTLLKYRTDTLAAKIEHFDHLQQNKIDSITATIGHLLDASGNFRPGVYASEREIVLRVGLESLKQQYASSIRSEIDLKHAKVEVRKIPQNLISGALDKLAEIDASETRKREIVSLKSDLLAIAKQRMRAISWDEAPKGMADTSVEFRIVHWFSSKAGQIFVDQVFSHLRLYASRSTAKIDLGWSSKSMVLSVGRSLVLKLPAYIPSKTLCVLFNAEGLTVSHLKISDDKEQIVLAW